LTTKTGQRNPPLFFVIFESRIPGPRWKKIWIQNKHPGSPTLLSILLLNDSKKFLELLSLYMKDITHLIRKKLTENPRSDIYEMQRINMGIR
jgi:hypothetical protein